MLRGRYHRLDGLLSRPVELDDADAVDALVAEADRVDLGPTLAWLERAGWCSARAAA